MLYTKTRNTDFTYGPTTKGNYYLPNPAHGINSTNFKKHKWRINENEEYSVFEFAEEPELFCKENNCYFSIINNGKVILGNRGERIAKFPKPQNASDPWHG